MSQVAETDINHKSPCQHKFCHGPRPQLYTDTLIRLHIPRAHTLSPRSRSTISPKQCSVFGQLRPAEVAFSCTISNGSLYFISMPSLWTLLRERSKTRVVTVNYRVKFIVLVELFTLLGSECEQSGEIPSAFRLTHLPAHTWVFQDAVVFAGVAMNFTWEGWALWDSFRGSSTEK